jgi:hypothetical protein
MSLKNPVTPPGINPGTVRLVAQHLNHYITPVLERYLVEIPARTPDRNSDKCARFGRNMERIYIYICRHFNDSHDSQKMHECRPRREEAVMQYKDLLFA